MKNCDFCNSFEDIRDINGTTYCEDCYREMRLNKICEALNNWQPPTLEETKAYYDDLRKRFGEDFIKEMFDE